MTIRLDYAKASPKGFQTFYSLERYTRNCSIEHSLLELVKIRASQINGCSYCIDMHSKDARVEGESEQRLYLLSAWREAPFYTERERAALEWTESLTLIADNHVPDELYERIRPHFTEEELVDLTLVIVTINGWNRIVSSFRPEVGSYQPAQKAQ